VSYFKPFPLVKYKFGNEDKSVFFQNLTTYVDLIDEVADNFAFYQSYEIIDGDRPDTLSFKLYGTSEYHWTFYLLNDNIRESGWPVPYMELDEIIDGFYPNYVLRLDNLTVNGVDESTLDAPKYFGNVFKPNDIITAQINAQSENFRVLDRNLDIGSFTIAPFNESLTQSSILGITTVTGNNGYDAYSIYYKSYSSTVNSITIERDAIHHYEQNNEYYDIDPFDFSSIPVDVVAVTNADRIEKENEKLKTIRIIKPDNIEQIVSEFNRLVTA